MRPRHPGFLHRESTDSLMIMFFSVGHIYNILMIQLMILEKWPCCLLLYNYNKIAGILFYSGICVVIL